MNDNGQEEAEQTSPLNFNDVVLVRSSERTLEMGIAGKRGVVSGISTADESDQHLGYAVFLYDFEEAWSLLPEELVATGEQDQRLLELEDDGRISAAGPVVEDLRQIGLDVDELWDLYELRPLSNEALEVFLVHMKCEYPDALLGQMARTVAVCDGAADRWSELVALFNGVTDGESDFASGLSATLSAVAEKNRDEMMLDDLLELAREPRFGSNRVLLLKRFYRCTRHPRVREFLEALEGDSELGEDAGLLLRQGANLERKEQHRKQPG